MTRLVALGDSFTCGEGVGVRVPTARTWTSLLCAAIPGASLTSYAAPGARVRDIRQHQVARVSAASIVTVLVGLNDVVRSDFHPDLLHSDLLAVVEQLGRTVDTVLLGRLHDPVRLLWVPAPLRRVVRARVEAVNAAVDEAARLPRVHVLDLDEVEALRHPAAWAVDRVHPAPAGHAAIAEAAAQVLRAAGHEVTATAPVSLPRVASHRARLLWLGRHGLPYLARHVRELGPPALDGVLRRT